jgi:hypothetical protein
MDPESEPDPDSLEMLDPNPDPHTDFSGTRFECCGQRIGGGGGVLSKRGHFMPNILFLFDRPSQISVSYPGQD